MLIYIYKDLSKKKDKTIQYNKLRYDSKNKKMNIEVIVEEKTHDKKSILDKIKKLYNFDIIKDNNYYYLIDIEDDIEEFLYDNHIRYEIA
jgi:hypothetical protein